MAIDTREKRFSMLNFSWPVPVGLFEADGAVDADDRAHLLNLYAGITLAAPVADERLPLVIADGVVEQLQSGDILINQEGTVVYAAAVLATDNAVLRADGTGFGSQTSDLSITDLGQLVFGQSPFNVIIGTSATGGSITTGVDNVLLGGFAGAVIEDGIRNMCIGGSAGGELVSGDGNTCAGFGSLFNATDDDNVAIGHDAGGEITSGSFCTFIGSGAGDNISQLATAVNSMALGSLAFTTASNQVVLGNTSITETLLRGDVTIENGGLTLEDGENVVLDTTTGTKVGTAVTQKLGFWDKAPIVQPAAANQAALTNSSGGTRDGTIAAIGDTTTVDGGPAINDNFTDVHELLDEIRTALVNSGIMKGLA